MRLLILFLVSLALTLGQAAETANPAAKIVERVLDGFHLAASKADGAAYFAFFAPEAIFIGTDASERWTVAEFKKFAEPYFSKGQGWTYTAKSRHVDFTPSGEVAWFDELLDNSSYGVCRGTGVLRKIGGEWKICQYHLTIPVPNELAKETAKMIRELKTPERERK